MALRRARESPAESRPRTSSRSSADERDLDRVVRLDRGEAAVRHRRGRRPRARNAGGRGRSPRARPCTRRARRSPPRRRRRRPAASTRLDLASTRASVPAQIVGAVLERGERERGREQRAERRRTRAARGRPPRARPRPRAASATGSARGRRSRRSGRSTARARASSAARSGASRSERRRRTATIPHMRRLRRRAADESRSVGPGARDGPHRRASPTVARPPPAAEQVRHAEGVTRWRGAGGRQRPHGRCRRRSAPRPSPARRVRCPTPAPAPGRVAELGLHRRDSAGERRRARRDRSRAPPARSRAPAGSGSSPRPAPTAAGPTRRTTVEQQEAGEHPVAGGREVAEDHVARLLAAEHEVVLRPAPRARCGRRPGSRPRRCRARASAWRSPRFDITVTAIASLRSAPRCVEVERGDHHDLVAVDEVAALVDREHAVGVAVEREPERPRRARRLPRCSRSGCVEPQPSLMLRPSGRACSTSPSAPSAREHRRPDVARRAVRAVEHDAQPSRRRPSSAADEMRDVRRGVRRASIVDAAAGAVRNATSRDEREQLVFDRGARWRRRACGRRARTA